MRKDKLLDSILRGSANVSFADAVALLKALGFSLARRKGSHHIFKHPDIDELINIQDYSGKIKRYQLRQLVTIIERYGLTLGDDE